MKYRAFYIISAISLIVSIFVGTILITAMDLNFYHQEHIKLNTSEYSGLTIAQLDQAMVLLIDYIDGSIETLDFQMEDAYSGEVFELFNEKEKAHMVDVRVLYQRAFLIGVASLMLACVCLVFVIIKRKSLAVIGLSFYFNRISIVVLGLVGMILFLAVINFSYFWTNFHHLVFSNDLWLLNPLTDRLITIVHAEVFFDLVLKIGIRFLFVFIALNGFCYLIQKKYRKGDSNDSYRSV